MRETKRQRFGFAEKINRRRSKKYLKSENAGKH